MVVVTGAAGQLGKAIVDELALQNIEYLGIDRSTVDLSQAKELQDFFKDKKIEAIVHCAANTNVEFCETNKKVSYRDNVQATKNLVDLSLQKEAYFMYMSSTGIYGDDQKTPYSEVDTVHPTTVHHSHKLESEGLIAASLSKYVILRTGWIFSDLKKSFVFKILESLSGLTEMKSNTEQVGNPVYSKDIARSILEFLKKAPKGLFNLVGARPVSRYEFVCEIVKLSGQNIKVEPVLNSHFKRLAKVSMNESASCKKMIKQGLTPLPDWSTGLKEVVNKFLS